ncbi:MAG: bifunctional UDP-3-O-[3-hydroxymyristoyl] N-acetylglucosamine deacetylase/3-hydroxyacyl-ACP dehydratase [Verrucomicrobiota bacterium]
MSVTYQNTLEKEASLVGTSLHTGKEVNLTLKPASVGTGIVFRRLDLPDQPVISAHIKHVNQVERATTISEGAIKIHTVEHLLSSLRGMGVDNAIIDMDSNEPPIGDGSAELFIKLIQKAGVVRQEEPRQYFEIKDPIYVKGDDDAYIAAFPYDGLKISCTNANHTGHFTQYLSMDIDEQNYAKELGRARTFVFYEEVQPLMEKGLIKGGSLENAIVIRDKSILSKDPLRYEDEFVRHKIMDIVGDMSLFPVFVKGHIMAAKPSHKLNAKFAEALVNEYQSYLSNLMPVENIPVGESALDVDQVMKILPHRYPFLMVDRVLKFEGETKAVGVKTVTINEPYFQGHFPQMPVMPGVLQVEAMAQMASILMLRKADNAGKIGFFMSADKIKFRKMVKPGDTLLIHVDLVKFRGKIGRAVGKCTVNDEIVSEGELMFAIQ